MTPLQHEKLIEEGERIELLIHSCKTQRSILKIIVMIAILALLGGSAIVILFLCPTSFISPKMLAINIACFSAGMVLTFLYYWNQLHSLHQKYEGLITQLQRHYEFLRPFMGEK